MKRYTETCCPVRTLWKPASSDKRKQSMDQIVPPLSNSLSVSVPVSVSVSEKRTGIFLASYGIGSDLDILSQVEDTNHTEETSKKPSFKSSEQDLELI